MFLLPMAAALVSVVIWAGGVWMVSGVGCVRATGAAAWARGGMVAAAVAIGVYLLLFLNTAPVVLVEIAACAAAVACAIGAAGIVSVCGRLAGLTRRVRYWPDGRRRRVRRGQFTLFCIAAVMWSAAVCVDVALGTRPGEGGRLSLAMSAVGAFSGLGGIGLFVFALVLVWDVRGDVVDEVGCMEGAGGSREGAAR